MKSLLLALAMVLGCSKHPDDDHVGRDAVAAMKAYTDESHAVVQWFPDVAAKLGRDLLVDAAAASKLVSEQLLPRLDAYIATVDRAILTADLYLATGVDVGSATQRQIDQIRRRATALHTARDAFARIGAKLAAGTPSLADLEQMSHDLMSAGVALTLAP